VNLNEYFGYTKGVRTIMKSLHSIIQALCVSKLQNLWVCLICGILLLIPGFLLGIMVGVQIGAPLGGACGARLGGEAGFRIGYWGLPIVIILFFLGLFLIIGINIGNLIGWLMSKLGRGVRAEGV
jgi:hypothetical protein